MALHFLKFNDSKTEIILFGQIENVASVNVHLGPLAAHNKVAVKNVGVWFDRELKFDKQITNVVKSCFFNLRLLAKVNLFSLLLILRNSSMPSFFRDSIIVTLYI